MKIIYGNRGIIIRTKDYSNEKNMLINNFNKNNENKKEEIYQLLLLLTSIGFTEQMFPKTKITQVPNNNILKLLLLIEKCDKENRNRNYYDWYLNFIKLTYQIKKGDKEVKVLGNEFIKNNFSKCKIIFKDRKYKLMDKIILNDEDKKANYMLLK